VPRYEKVACACHEHVWLLRVSPGSRAASEHATPTHACRVFAQATVTEAIGTATKATQFLSSVSVIITIAPVVTALDASEHDGVDAGVMTGAIGGPLFGLLGIGGYVYYTQTKRGGQNVAVTAKPDV